MFPALHDIEALCRDRVCFRCAGMPRGWDSELRVSFSATTGQLADNHDLLSVKLIKAGGRLPRSVDEEEVNPREIQSLERQVQKQSGGAQIVKLMKLYRRDAEMRLNHLHHAVEHELSFIQDSLESAINKIRDAEKEDQLRISDLEEKAAKVAEELLERHVAVAVSAHVQNQLGDMEEHKDEIKQHVSEQLKGIHSLQADMHAKTIQHAASMAERSGGAGWITILVIVGVFAGVVYYLSRRLSKMEKNHLP